MPTTKQGRKCNTLAAPSWYPIPTKEGATRMLKLILLLSICLNVTAAEKSKYSKLELRNIKYLKLEVIAAKRYYSEANKKYLDAQEKEESKEDYIEDSEKSYIKLRKKYKCIGGLHCTHSKMKKCFRSRTTLRKAYGAIEKAEDKLKKLKKDTKKNKALTKSRKAQYAKFLKAYKALINK